MPKAGAPGSQTQTVGNGFDPNATLDLYFDTTNVGLVDTDNNGSFGMALRAPTLRQNGFTIHIPDDAVPGQHWITAVERITQLQAQVPFTVSIDWPQFQFDAQHTGFNPYENALSPQTVGNLRYRWMHLTNNTWMNSPTVWNGIVYLSSTDLYAFDATTGALLWANPAPLALWGSPAVANGILYLGGTDGTYGWIYALNATTGVTIWKYLDDGASAPTVVNGVVYVSGYYYLYALDASTGAILWKYQGAEGGVTSPAVANGVVYIGYEFGQMHALNATTGALIWKYTTGGWIRSASLAVADGVVYVGSHDNNVYALSAETGALLWKYTTGGEIDSSPAVANGAVYIGSNDGNVYALSAKTGTLLWKYTAGDKINSSPAVANGVVYVGSWDKNVYALDATTGALLWKYTTRGMIFFSSPAVANDMVYIMSEQSLYAFGLPNQQTSEKLSPPERPDPARLTPNWSLQPSHAVTNKSVKPQ